MDNFQSAILRGKVTKYKGNGRKLGYPTANLNVKSDLKDGIYFGHADMGEWHNHPALIFVGTPVSMGDSGRRVEAYLLDIPDIDYYGSELVLRVESFHRPNLRFDSVNELLKAMKSDEKAARQWFSSGSGRL